MNTYSNENQPFIELKNITRYFKFGEQEMRAIDEVDLKINKGDFISIVGPSGSGKSTLLNIIGLIDQANEGFVYLEDKNSADFETNYLDNLRLNKFGFVFQNFNLIPVLNVLENVMFPLMILDVDKKEAKKRAIEVISLVGLTNRLKYYPKNLSAGECQRVAIARALVGKPALILADEPTGNLDSFTTKEVVNLFLKINQELKTTVILVTHNPTVAEVADRKYKIVDGKLIEIDELNLKQEIERLFTGAKERNSGEYRKVFYNVGPEIKKIANDNLVAIKGLSNLLWVLFKNKYQEKQDRYFLERLHVILNNQFIDTYIWHAMIFNLAKINIGENFDSQLLERYQRGQLNINIKEVHDRLSQSVFQKISEAIDINPALYQAISRADYFIEGSMIKYKNGSGNPVEISIELVKQKTSRYLEMLEKFISRYLAEINS